MPYAVTINAMAMSTGNTHMVNDQAIVCDHDLDVCEKESIIRVKNTTS